MQDGSYLDKAMKVTESRALGWATSIRVANQVGLEAGQSFLNPLYQLHENRSEVYFVLTQAAQALPQC